MFFYLFHIFLYISLESYFMSRYHFSFCFASKKIGLCLQTWLGFPICEDVICKNRGGTGEPPKVCIGTDTSNFIA